jgi:20S proteasome alpha/beta subunit
MIIQGIENIDPTITDETEPLTTILAIKCPDGIVMASDSQATVRSEKAKTLGVTKIFNVNNFICVGGSGDADNITLFAEYLIQEFPKMLSTESKFRDKIESAFWHLHKKYNLNSREYLGENTHPFSPTLLVGAKNKDDSFGLYLLKENGMVYPKNEHVVIGSGGDLARLVIKQLNRSMTVAGGSLHKLPVESAISVSCYIINEVKESDSQSGGETKVMVIDSKGLKALSREEVQENYDKFLGIMTIGLAPIGLSIEDIKKLWPTGY